ncbi:MAG: type II toxin-antitoxin system VapC family toxin [Acidobacteriia bacterium]|nr:type II toxin-antitoxin system VapC family toxin [Terriglobia bacterium]
MAILLDTHAFLWWSQNDSRLSSRAREAIVDSECFFSLASCWEVAIKVSLERLRFDRPVSQFFAEQLLAAGVSLIPIEFRHVMRVAQLPFHHRDPFDRLLIAQALEQDFSIVSSDRAFDAYGVKRIW